MKQKQNTLLIFFSLLFFTSFLTAQMFEKNEKTTTSSNSVVPSLSNQFSSISTPILDGPVDPKEYRIGPGDIFNVSIWASTPLNFQVPVTPEGSVIIPTVGEVMISGMPLDSAKEKTLKEIKKKYISGTSSFTLLSPRTFSVTVKGAVKEEGSRYVQATQRVDVVVNYRKDIREPVDTTIAQRKIIVKHRSGIQSIADIEKYYATGNTMYNPLLQDGDLVIVPSKNINSDFVTVFGATNKQGRFEFVEGDSLSTMLRIARGLTAIADSEHVVITRFFEGKKPEIINVSLKKIISGTENDVVLKRADRIVVYEQYLPQRGGRVAVAGEVKFPGYYPIGKDSTLLSEIIERAGGITQYASLKNAQLYRGSISGYDIAIERMMSGRGGITSEDSAYYFLETDIRMNRELVVTDFTELLLKKNSAKDIVLRDGDYISIPAVQKTIYVFGQVVHPGHVLFQSGKDVNYYLSQAGGLTDYARKGDIRIIKAGTRQWLDPQDTKIEEGDYIWIPKEPYRPYTYYLTVYSQVFGIVATTVSLFVLILK